MRGRAPKSVRTPASRSVRRRRATPAPREVWAQRIQPGAYQGNPETDNIAAHRSLYLSMFGEDLAAGEGRRTQMRMIIGKFGSDQNKHISLYDAFLNDVKSIPRFHDSPPD